MIIGICEPVIAAHLRDLRSYPTSINTAAFERDRWVIGIGAASNN